MFRASALLGVLLAPSLVFAATLSTTTPNNGSGGIFMDFTAGAAAISVTGFETYFGASNSLSVAVYTRPGSYAGTDGDSAGWTLHETVNTSSAGPEILAPVPLTTPISIGAGQTVAIYLHSLTNQGVRYNGTGVSPPQTTWSDANLTVFSDRARTGNVPFAGLLFTPRTFAGNIYYNVDGEVPEPGTVTFLGLGLAGFAFLRRKSA
ncbi:MAG: PEP-CTERM sorting domain-containing protein [Bryobacteraceae bacterium]